MIVGSVVLHPRRPEMELLATGAALDAPMIQRLRELGVGEMWVHHDAMADLDTLVVPKLAVAKRAVYERIKQDFSHLAVDTITTAQLQAYRQTVMELVCELVGNRRVAGLTEQLFSEESALFSHCANVAYLATLAGLELETYVVAERSKLLLAEQKRDMPSLGVGAMLHDIGKTRLPVEQHDYHELDEVRGEAGAPAVNRPEQYPRHTIEGYMLLRGSRAPASATQVVLNHHQRFDGTGGPDMEEVTEGRQKGAQSGRQIHIFARIVAAANVLDNLLREADGSKRPPVAALHDLGGERFKGWFDPVVREVMMRRFPPFRMGSHVVLSDGRDAAVVSPSAWQPCRPAVRLLAESSRDEQGRHPTIALEKASPQLHIAECAGVDVTPWLFTLSDRRRGRAKAG